MSNRFFSLYDALRELCKEKKMMFFKPTLGLEYIPAKISKGKEWYVYFYVADPTSGALVRVRKKINRIKNLKERLKAGRQMVISLNERLALGCFPMELKFYSLKDSGITNMLGSGVPVSFVKQQADHSSLAMTSIYLGKSPNASEELKKTHIIK